MKNLKLLLIVTLMMLNVTAQEETILVKVKNENKIEALRNNFNITSIEKAFVNSKSESLQNVYEIKIGDQLNKIFDHLSNNPDFSNPVINEPFEVLYETNDYSAAFTEDYALDIINARGAWETTTGDTSVIIGISDSNYDIYHEELQDAFSYIHPDITHSNINHGTAVAVTAAGNTNNGLGKSNIGYNCDMHLYAMSYNQLLEASYNGARVVNLSWASGCNFNQYHQNVLKEVHENGTIIVAAAGNGSTCGGPTSYVYPASYEYVISVSATGREDNHERIAGDQSSTFQHNDSVHLVAPGYDVAITLANNIYTISSGTSFSAPYVSGTIGLMLSANPCLKYNEVLTILKESAKNIDDLNADYVGLLGAGRLDASEAVKMAAEYTSLAYNYTEDYSCSTETSTIVVSPTVGTSPYSIEWENGESDFEITISDAGSFNFELQDDTGCKLNAEIVVEELSPSYDYTGLVTLSDSTELKDLDGDGEIRVKGTLIIKKDEALMLEGKKIVFIEDSSLIGSAYPTSGVVVEKNGTLTVKDCSFSTLLDCQASWGGIYMGSSDDYQTVSNWELILENTSIENAVVGVSNLPNENLVGADYGSGAVAVNNSTFINNRNSIVLSGSDKQTLISSIENSNFIHDDASEMVSFITTKELLNLKLKNNTFIGNKELNPEERGVGVLVLNSDFEPTSPSNEVASYFRNLKQAVVIKNTSSEQKHIRVNNYDFKNVHTAISINGFFEGEIERNTISLAEGNTDVPAYGIKTESENKLTIADNTIYSEASAGFNYGTVIKNNINGGAILFRNDFEGVFYTASSFEGNNEGVAAFCNNYMSSGINNWNVLGEKFASQGSEDSAILNNFSDCGEVEVNIAVDDICENFTYFTTEDFSPQCSDENVNISAVFSAKSWEESCTSLDEVLTLSTDNLEEKKESRSLVYPNPSNGNFTVSWNNTFEPTSVSVYAVEGKLVKTHTIGFQEKDKVFTGYNSGTYIVRLTDDNGSNVSQKLVIH